MQEKTIERGLAFIVGMYIFWTLIANLLTGFQVPNWHQVTGRIVKSYVKDHKIYHKTVIEYEYLVGGKVYRSHRLGAYSADHLEPFQSDAQSIIRQYPVGRNVAVYFDPKKPQLATLNLKFRGKNLEYLLNLFTWFFAMLLWTFAFGWTRGGWDEDQGQRQIGFDLIWSRLRRRR